jgi:hypothetical protein
VSLREGRRTFYREGEFVFRFAQEVVHVQGVVRDIFRDWINQISSDSVEDAAIVRKLLPSDARSGPPCFLFRKLKLTLGSATLVCRLKNTNVAEVLVIYSLGGRVRLKQKRLTRCQSKIQLQIDALLANDESDDTPQTAAADWTAETLLIFSIQCWRVRGRLLRVPDQTPTLSNQTLCLFPSFSSRMAFDPAHIPTMSGSVTSASKK